MNKINNELLLLRFKESGYKSSELAEMTGMSRNTIRNIMYGITTPTYYVALELAIALQLSIRDIIIIYFPYLIVELNMKHEKTL